VENGPLGEEPPAEATQLLVRLNPVRLRSHFAILDCIGQMC